MSDDKLNRRWVAATARNRALRQLAALYPQAFRDLYVECYSEVDKAYKAAKRAERARETELRIAQPTVVSEIVTVTLGLPEQLPFTSPTAQLAG